MAIHEILIWPDPLLMKKSEPIKTIDDSIKTLARDMLETMYAHDGVGLAAPQIGVHLRLVVIDIHSADAERPSGEEPLILINPEFLVKEGKMSWDEGCLSVPGEYGPVSRASKVKVRYLDLDGNEQFIEAEGLKAVALQHECDHLEGKIFVEYLGPLKRSVIKRKMEKLRTSQKTNKPTKMASKPADKTVEKPAEKAADVGHPERSL